MVFLRVSEKPPKSRKLALDTVSHFVGPAGRAKILILNRAAASAHMAHLPKSGNLCIENPIRADQDRMRSSLICSAR